MNVLGAIIAGLIGTVVMSVVTAMAPAMGLPKMDIVGMLGSMFSRQGNRGLGWAMHLMMGAIFAIVYAALWSAGVGGANVAGGALFGLLHWLAVGLMMGAVPMMHAGIRAGAVEAPGVYMTRNGGAMAFMGGLIGHVIFGLVVALVYAPFAG